MKIKGIEFSEETIVRWAEDAGVRFDKLKPEFEPIRACCFDVTVEEGDRIRISVNSGYNGKFCSKGSDTIDILLKALQKAKAFVEANK